MKDASKASKPGLLRGAALDLPGRYRWMLGVIPGLGIAILVS